MGSMIKSWKYEETEFLSYPLNKEINTLEGSILHKEIVVISNYREKLFDRNIRFTTSFLQISKKLYFPLSEKKIECKKSHWAPHFYISVIYAVGPCKVLNRSRKERTTYCL